ncbi:MAG: glycerate kinase [Pseudomonadota bacterium]
MSQKSRAPAAEPREALHALLSAAIDAADPATALAPHLPEPPAGALIALGAGKAAASMAAALEARWTGPLRGVVVTRYGHAAKAPCARIEVLEAAHPEPDEAGRAATERLLAAADAAGPDDLVLCLLSGGGSALLTAPPPGVPFAEKQALTKALLASGAAIDEINAVRKHLSAVKGGRLVLRAAPARVLTLAISDVPGDDPAVIASGPTAPDPSTCAEARAVLRRYGVAVSDSVEAWLASAAAETPKPGDPRLASAAFVTIATPQTALERAAAAAEALGYAAHILSDRIEGEAREAAKTLGPIARAVAARGAPFAPPCVLLSGGETTVTLRGPAAPGACGGPNAEFALALAIALGGAARIHALSADTDGVDGAAEIAGAVVAPDTLARAAALGLSPRDALERHDAHGFFAALGDQVITGPTLTNVNDFRAMLIEAP